MTREYTIDWVFSSDARNEIKKAVEASTELPEGIFICKPGKENPRKPFVVISSANLRKDELREEFSKGAIRVVTAFSARDILKQLDTSNQ